MTATSTASAHSLSGLRVLDLSRVLAGPFCGAMLGDMGADVLKIEDTRGGDEARTWPPQREGESAMYVANNRNKRGICIDLKAPEGVEIILDLVRKSDVVIENFRTGTMESFGLGYETLARENPGIIYSSVSAFGRTGPRADSAGYEALIQAFSGIMSITGETDGPPTRAGVSALDIMTGTMCAFGILNAILYRQQTGLGQRVDGSLLDTSLSLLNFHIQNYLFSGVASKRVGAAHTSIVPYRNYRCKDAEWIFIAGANERLWERLAKALKLDWMLQDPRFATNTDRVNNRRAVDVEVEAMVAQYDREELLELLDEAGVPVSPVNSVDQALRDPQTANRTVLKRMSHPMLGEIDSLGLPLEFSRLTSAIRRHAPRLGEHTDEVLAELGYSVERIVGLRAGKVVA